MVAATQAATPSPDLPPPGEANLPEPTAEQVSTADRVFTDPDPATTLFGVLTGVMLLRDVAVDTFAVAAEEDEEEEKPGEDLKK